ARTRAPWRPSGWAWAPRRRRGGAAAGGASLLLLGNHVDDDAIAGIEDLARELGDAVGRDLAVALAVPVEAPRVVEVLLVGVELVGALDERLDALRQRLLDAGDGARDLDGRRRLLAQPVDLGVDDGLDGFERAARQRRRLDHEQAGELAALAGDADALRERLLQSQFAVEPARLGAAEDAREHVALGAAVGVVGGRVVDEVGAREPHAVGEGALALLGVVDGRRGRRRGR